MSLQTLSSAPVVEFDRRAVRRLTAVPAPEMFETLLIHPAPAFPRTALRLVEIPKPRAAREFEQAEPNPLKLTRRGRLALVAAAFLCVVFGFSIGPSFSIGSATPTPLPSGHGVVVQPGQIVVQPGETLWGIASRVAPNTDPRVTVQRIIDLNDLPGPDLQAGQALSLPS